MYNKPKTCAGETMKIGFRTIKTAVGVSLSILLAQSLHLEYFTAAGILTLLCIQRSRRQSAKAVFSRLCACFGSLLSSAALFQWIGYYPYAFLIFLLLFIPLCVRFGVQEGIASSSVIVMHVYMHKSVEPAFFLNEVLVILIGLGVALLVNWYMPSIDKELVRYRDEVDRLIGTILDEIAKYLKEGYTLWDGKELLQLPALLDKARSLAKLDAENKRSGCEHSFGQYFETKRKQSEILEWMLPSVSRISIQMDQGIRIGDFVEELKAELAGRSGRSSDLSDKLRTIREYHKQLPLPESREEFENRASLYAVANDLERFVKTI